MKKRKADSESSHKEEVYRNSTHFIISLKEISLQARVSDLFDHVLLESLKNCIIILHKYRSLWNKRPKCKTFDKIDALFHNLMKTIRPRVWIMKSFLLVQMNHPELKTIKAKDILKNSKHFDIKKEDFDQDCTFFNNNLERALGIPRTTLENERK